jgi:pimeloyl-ACP methyl ester carboxylesterase
MKTSARRLLCASLLLAMAATAARAADEGGLKRRAYLGAALEPAMDGKGARVMAVKPGTPAAAAGLASGDRVLKINGRAIDSPAAFEIASGGLYGGETAEFEVEHEGKVAVRRIALKLLPKEELPGVDVRYGSVVSERGDRLRTVVTRPKDSAGKRLPGLLLAGWLSCDSVEFPLGANAGFSKLLQGLAKESGFQFMRVDKPGVGDSGGPPCSEVDFDRELAGYRAGLKALKSDPGVDPDRVFIFGMSNGGGIAPLVAAGEKVRGYVVSGAWVKTWYEHMIENERRRLALSGESAGQVAEHVRGFESFYDLYLNRRLTPAEVLKQRPELTPLWYDQPGHQYGRPAAFYHQLQALNLAAAWDKVEVPVLVVYGENDWIMSRQDHEMIAEIVNHNHPGLARFVAIPKMDHLFYIQESMKAGFDNYDAGTFDPAVLKLMVDWLKGHA